ncbi:hypothetical protein [Rhodococcus yananensis]|uniref:hypothetical protein n=1 Tax=Rhodococcus yananensis TaxID=2879464 RepID=UPI001CF928B1|nr:hypothetical protein [Rhodococcus yananensis]
MLEPNGPLPPEIYWRRRVVAIIVAVLVLILVIWAAVALIGGGDDPETEPLASESVASESATTTTTTTTAAAADGSADAAGAETGSGGSGSGGAAGGTGSSDAGAASGDTAATTPATAAALSDGQCSDQSLAVRVTSSEANYQVGAEPEFTIVITNIGTSTCERDLGAGLQEVLVYSLDGNRRLWSNTDCFPESTADVRSLGPGDQAAFSVKWSGTTSEPGCEAPREPVGPGAYTVVGQLGGLRSTPEPFNIA